MASGHARNSSVKNLLGDISWYSAVPFLQQVIGLFLVPIYTYYLSPQDYGVAALVALVVMLLGNLANWGVTYALMRDYIQLKGDDAREFLFTSLVVALGSACVVYGGFFLIGKGIIPLIASEWRPEYNLYLNLALLTSVLQTCDAVAMTFLVVERRPALYSLVQIIVYVISVAIQLYLLIAMKLGVLALFVTPLLTAAAGMIQALIILRPHMKPRIRRDALRAIGEYGRQTVPLEVVGYMLRRMDRWIIQSLMPLSQLGLYSFAAKFQEPFGVYAESVKKSWRPEYFRQLHDKADPALIIRSSNVIIELSLVLILAGMLFTKEVMQLLAAPEYHSTFVVASILIAQVFFQKIVLFVPGNSLTFEKKLSYNMITAVVTSGINIGLSLWLIPRMGLEGAAIAVVVAFVVYAGMTFYWAKRYTAVGAPTDWKRVLFLTILCAVLSLPAFVPTEMSFISLAIVKAIALLLFTVVIAFLEREWLSRMRRKISVSLSPMTGFF